MGREEWKRSGEKSWKDYGKFSPSSDFTRNFLPGMDATRCIDDLDRDFHFKDTNESHKWLFSYPGKLMPNQNELTTSTMKSTFCEPERKSVSKQGKRKKILEMFYRQIIADELKAEFDSDETIVEPYETDYTEHFKHPDDMPLPGECCSKNELNKKDDKSCPNPMSKTNEIDELKTKYPLYTSRPFTFAAQVYGKDKFGKKYTISKPMDQNYDNIEY